MTPEQVETWRQTQMDKAAAQRRFQALEQRAAESQTAARKAPRPKRSSPATVAGLGALDARIAPARPREYHPTGTTSDYERHGKSRMRGEAKPQRIRRSTSTKRVYETKRPEACITCGRTMRSHTVKAVDAPGTIQYAGAGQCATCYRQRRNGVKPMNRAPDNCKGCDRPLWVSNKGNRPKEPGKVQHDHSGYCKACNRKRGVTK